MERLQNIQVIIDPEVAGMRFDVRRPYFRMRGRPVTEEQAFDIIRRTDNFFYWDMYEYRLEGLAADGFVLENSWYCPKDRPHLCGWVRPDGIVGMNRSTLLYPAEEDFLNSVLPLKEAFPYLDFVIAVTDWNACPECVWDILRKATETIKGSADEILTREDADLHRELLDVASRAFSLAYAREEDYPDFPGHIIYGVWVHDDKVELTAPARAREKYLEYNRLYGGADEAVFTRRYYDDRNLHPADFAYLQRCIRSHGLDPDEVLAPYEWTSEGLRRKRGRPAGPGGKGAVFPENGRNDGVHNHENGGG